MNVIAFNPDASPRKVGKKRRVDYARVRELAGPPHNWKPEQIAADQRCSAAYVRLILKNKIGTGASQANSRMPSQPVLGRPSVAMPAIDNPAIMEGRSLFSADVLAPDGDMRIFKSGHSNAKLGKTIRKGAWKGFEVYALALEERRTCPKTCHHWRSCFGNNMPMAHRFAHGPALEARIMREVPEICEKHPNGVAIRLHTLGDFYSVRYVDLWALLLKHYPNLHVFGFSARAHPKTDPIAAALVRLVMQHWGRFAIRFSDAPIDECATVSIEHPYQKPADAIICPQQTGKTESCSTCALCWSSRKRIAFISH